MRISNEFYLTKNEKINYLGEVIETQYELNSFDGYHLQIKFQTLEELLGVPYDNPKEFIEFLSKHWTKEDLNNFLNQEDYYVEGLNVKLDGERYGN
ncbi:hypothetical protein [Heyndrickxia camelliae]|uniref:Uncharacterized protein n=1 Tax=Heyndrickxia camelliae TaxID=1707093 RepID=A0A2N3LCV4_9BACI|nr:hypothetical protein [Heyndrickxia camelliae]PKR82393.1 hypothetical protein CWO92_24710 [Heyndrickxia camelliae]